MSRASISLLRTKTRHLSRWNDSASSRNKTLMAGIKPAITKLRAGWMNTSRTLPPIPLPSTIRSRFVDDINGLSMHVLEAGFESKGRPCVLLLHGFPELAFSWRKVMPALAEAGYHVIAPDQRGYGRTTGRDPSHQR